MYGTVGSGNEPYPTHTAGPTSKHLSHVRRHAQSLAQTVGRSLIQAHDQIRVLQPVCVYVCVLCVT